MKMISMNTYFWYAVTTYRHQCELPQTAIRQTNAKYCWTLAELERAAANFRNCLMTAVLK